MTLQTLIKELSIVVVVPFSKGLALYTSSTSVSKFQVGSVLSRRKATLDNKQLDIGRVQFQILRYTSILLTRVLFDGLFFSDMLLLKSEYLYPSKWFRTLR